MEQEDNPVRKLDDNAPYHFVRVEITAPLEGHALHHRARAVLRDIEADAPFRQGDEAQGLAAQMGVLERRSRGHARRPEARLHAREADRVPKREISQDGALADALDAGVVEDRQGWNEARRNIQGTTNAGSACRHRIGRRSPRTLSGHMAAQCTRPWGAWHKTHIHLPVGLARCRPLTPSPAPLYSSRRC
jgi:hypothetical protein